MANDICVNNISFTDICYLYLVMNGSIIVQA